jgi:hypothetical protein
LLIKGDLVGMCILRFTLSRDFEPGIKTGYLQIVEILKAKDSIEIPKILADNLVLKQSYVYQNTL